MSSSGSTHQPHPMDSSQRSYRAAHSSSPSAPPIPDPNEPQLAHPYRSPDPPSYNYHPTSQSHHHQYPTSSGYGPSYGYAYPPPPQQQFQAPFPPGTDPEVIRGFQMVDRDRSGFIEETELQQALSSGYQRFSMRTIRLLIFLFKTPSDPALRVGPKEFAALWSCLKQWRAIFERFDRDRSGRIDATELREALHSIGYAVPHSVFGVLVSRYDEGHGRKVELNFDSFVECGMIVKGLTEKFKEKDPGYTGSAKLSYETFMTMIIPFLVSY